MGENCRALNLNGI